MTTSTHPIKKIFNKSFLVFFGNSVFTTLKYNFQTNSYNRVVSVL